MKIILIAALDQHLGIGYNNQLLKPIKEDLQRFKQLTQGFPIVMGRKTWDSLPKKPLPNRLNIILSSTLLPETQESIWIRSNLREVITELQPHVEKLFVIGGGQIYAEALPYADSLELTLIHEMFEADTFFPTFDTLFTEVWREDHNGFSFVRYEKSKL